MVELSPVTIEKKELCDLVVKKYVNNQILSKSEDKKINLI